MYIFKRFFLSLSKIFVRFSARIVRIFLFFTGSSTRLSSGGRSVICSRLIFFSYPYFYNVNYQYVHFCTVCDVFPLLTPSYLKIAIALFDSADFDTFLAMAQHG